MTRAVSGAMGVRLLTVRFNLSHSQTLVDDEFGVAEMQSVLGRAIPVVTAINWQAGGWPAWRKRCRTWSCSIT